MTIKWQNTHENAKKNRQVSWKTWKSGVHPQKITKSMQTYKIWRFSGVPWTILKASRQKSKKYPPKMISSMRPMSDDTCFNELVRWPSAEQRWFGEKAATFAPKRQSISQCLTLSIYGNYRLHNCPCNGIPCWSGPRTSYRFEAAGDYSQAAVSSCSNTDQNVAYTLSCWW